ncbi:MAG: UDP-N-acetyl-D-glucosamine dehydrogenase [Planctomycetes bacterium RBG_16_59_8]|nr:MAG: UDP-N-acetyl-D-glucosamine dehydrogenase [Planctomycetes bacterium RBG_16_59_8]
MKDLRKPIETKRAVVGVIGLGYVGLPLVRLFSGKGFTVVGFDVDRTKIEKLRKGKSYIKSFPSSAVATLVRNGRFTATDDFRRLRNVDAVIICVPTPLAADGQPDLSYIRRTAETIAKTLRRGQLVVLESTTYPGTTREVMKPILESGGLKAGKDFYLAFSPEREDPGRKDFTNADIPKVVGGIDNASLELAALLYEQAVVRVVKVSSCEVAESAKLLENIYRCVNIALVNELKVTFDKMGIDVWEVIHAAATKPFGFQPFYPGPGMGGHCIPIDPFYLTWRAREFGASTRFIELAGEINVQMPFHVVGKLEEALKKAKKDLAGAKVLILGIAYKKDIDDPRESPAFKIIEILKRKGAVVRFNDPHIPQLPSMRHYGEMKVPPVALTDKVLREHDAVVIVTDHSAYDYKRIVRHARLVIDTRNAAPRRKNVVPA